MEGTEERWVAGFDYSGKLCCGSILVKETAKQSRIVDRQGIPGEVMGFRTVFRVGSFSKSRAEALSSCLSGLERDVECTEKKLAQLKRKIEIVKGQM